MSLLFTWDQSSAEKAGATSPTGQPRIRARGAQRDREGGHSDFVDGETEVRKS